MGAAPRATAAATPIPARVRSRIGKVIIDLILVFIGSALFESPH
jgi:hypothetical protein